MPTITMYALSLRLQIIDKCHSISPILGHKNKRTTNHRCTRKHSSSSNRGRISRESADLTVDGERILEFIGIHRVWQEVINPMMIHLRLNLTTWTHITQRKWEQMIVHSRIFIILKRYTLKIQSTTFRQTPRLMARIKGLWIHYKTNLSK